MNTIPRSALLAVSARFTRARLFAAIASAALSTFVHSSQAAPADLDSTFGGNGKVVTPNIFVGQSDRSMILQDDGKIVVAGSSWDGIANTFAIARFNTNGSLDATFNGTGTVMTAIGTSDDAAGGIAVQPDGKLVAAGTSHSGGNADFAVVRYNPNGSLDTSFNGTGKVTTDLGSNFDHGISVAVQNDGKIIVVGLHGSNPLGSFQVFAIVRYNADGGLDTTFNGTGKLTTAFGSRDDSARSVAMQSDGKILVVGITDIGSGTVGNGAFAIARYNSNGSLDVTFNGTGKVVTDIRDSTDTAESILTLNEGKILVAGSSHDRNGVNYRTALVRYNSDGSLDSSFNGTGKVLTNLGNSESRAGGGQSVAVLDDETIFVCGGFGTDSDTDFALFCYRADGSLDTSFNGTGIVFTECGGNSEGGASVAVQSNGRIVVSGTSFAGSAGSFAVIRYEGYPDMDEDGIQDRYETGTGIYVSPHATGTSPTNPDTDGDGLNDGQEVKRFFSNPHVRDTDSDGFDDGFEVSTGFSPTSAASTPDTLSSAHPAIEYRFNAANGVSYRIESSTDLFTWETVETPVIGAGGVITRFYPTEAQPRRFFRSRRN